MNLNKNFIFKFTVFEVNKNNLYPYFNVYFSALLIKMKINDF